MNVIGTTFPANHQYGPDEIEIFKSTADQINEKFAGQRNLLINTTWFGPQFANGEWEKVEKLIASNATFDNLFLLSVIDPVYLTEDDIKYLESNLKTKSTYRIGMFDGSKLEWNFHSIVSAKHCCDLPADTLKLVDPVYAFLLYQRKPRRHRVELTRLLIEQGFHSKGIITLGTNKNSSYDWTEGLGSELLAIDDPPGNYHHGNDKPDDFGGIPNDLVTLGRLDIWQRHFLNVASETEFNQWHPRFVTEKTWKPIIGLRPFVIHGQSSVYSWLQNNGFQTFNHYWSHIPCDTGDDQHGNVLDVIDFLCKKSKEELVCMYADMLPVLEYNRSRFFEFAQEQKYKMNHLFQTREHV
jgi:hypothetical protein